MYLCCLVTIYVYPPESPGKSRSGAMFRGPDSTGLLEALREKASWEGIRNTTEAVHRAIEAYLRG